MAAGHYVVNQIAQLNGDHEVHLAGCNFFPSHRIQLGFHFGCASAVAAAKAYFPQSNGCYFCARECNTG
jgi:hypothetical protein